MIRRRAGGAAALGVQLGLQVATWGTGSPTSPPAVPLPAPPPPSSPSSPAELSADRNPPGLAGRLTAAPNGSGWYRAPVPVRWTVTDGGSGSAGDLPAGTVQGEGDRLVAAATAFDRAGNHRSAMTRPTVKIDLTPPVTTLEAPPGWAATDRSVLLAAVDNLSGVAAIRYRVDGGEPLDGDVVALPGPGDHPVEYWSVDVAGNEEPHRTVVLHVDDRAPVLSHQVSPAANQAGWHHGPVTVRFRCEPGAAAVRRCPPARTVTAEGPVPVAGVAVDHQGRRAVDPVTVSIDLTDPVVAVRADHVPARTGWYGEPLTLTFSCWDAVSGIADGGCPAPVTLEQGAGQRVSVSAQDLADNTVRLTVDSLDVDTTAPRTEHRLDRPTVRDGRVTVRVRLAARDPLSGVAGTYYRLDDGPVLRYRGRLTVPADAEHRLTYWSVDRAGNVEGDGRGRSLTLPPAVTAGDPAPPPASPSAPEPAVEPVDET